MLSEFWLFFQHSTDITSLEARPGWRLRPSLSGQNHQSPFLCPHYLVCILILLADSRRYVHGGRSEGGDNCSTGQVVVKKIPIELLGVFLQVPLASANYLEASQAAEVYHAENMISQCAEFLLEEMVDVNLEEVQVGALPMVMAAFGKRVKENKKRDSESLLEKYVKGASVPG